MKPSKKPRPQRSEQAVVAMDFFSRSMLAPGFMDDGKWRIIDPSQGQRRWKWYVPDNGKIVVRRNPIAGVVFNIVCRECRPLREVARALCLKRGKSRRLPPLQPLQTTHSGRAFRIGSERVTWIFGEK
jgi:hypothetical protein